MSASITTTDDEGEDDEEDSDEYLDSTETEDDENDSQLDSTDTTLTETDDTYPTTDTTITTSEDDTTDATESSSTLTATSGTTDTTLTPATITTTDDDDETASSTSTVRRTNRGRSFVSFVNASPRNSSASTLTPYDTEDDDESSNPSTVIRRTTASGSTTRSSSLTITTYAGSEDMSTEATDTDAPKMSSSRDQSSEVASTSYEYGSGSASRSQSDSQQQPSSAYYGSGSYAGDSYGGGSGSYGEGSGYYGSESATVTNQESVDNPHHRYQPYYDRGQNDSYQDNSQDRLNSVEPIDKVLNDLSAILERGQHYLLQMPFVSTKKYGFSVHTQSLVKQQRLSRQQPPPVKKLPPDRKNSTSKVKPLPPARPAPLVDVPPVQHRSILRPSRSMSREAKQQVSFGKISKSALNRPSLHAVRSRPAATSMSDFRSSRSRKSLSKAALNDKCSAAAFLSLHSTTLIIGFWAMISYFILSNCFFNDCAYYYLNNSDPASRVSVSTFSSAKPAADSGVKGWTTVSGRQDSKFYSPARHFYYSTTPADQRPACPFGYLHCGENNGS